MNTKLFDLTRCLLLTSLFFLMPWKEIRGQGFIRQYPTQRLSYQAAQSLYPRADGGFQLTATAFHSYNGDTTLIRLNVNALGQEIERDSITIPFVRAPEIYMLEDGGYLSAYNNSNQITINRIAANNDTVWHQILAFPNWYYASVLSMQPNEDGEVFLQGHLYDYPNPDSGYIAKFSNHGALLWVNTYVNDDSPSPVSSRTILPTPTGGCLICRQQHIETLELSADYWLLNFNGNDGSLLWSYPYPSSYYPYYVGRKDFTFKSPNLIYLPISALNVQVIDLNDGTLVSEVDPFVPYWNQYLRLLFPTANGGFVAIITDNGGTGTLQRIFRIDANGEIVWEKILPLLPDWSYAGSFGDGKELSDGSLVLYGSNYYYLSLIKLSADGIIFPNIITGRVARDSTYDCLPELTDPPLSNWVVTATGNGLTLYANTDAQGRYIINDIDTGNYVVKAIVPNYLWQPCVDSITLTFANSIATIDTADFSIQAAYDCAAMQVDLGVNALRPCFPATYALRWCNIGNQTAAITTIALHLDPLFEASTASIPYTQLGDTLWFDLGATPPGACGDILIYGSLSCDAVLGQTLCAAAYAFPDTLCAPNLPGWSGARIEVSATCAGDSVRMVIQNTGHAATSQALDFIVIDDHVITRQGNFNLQPAETRYETLPADGSTWRLIAQQEPGFPFGSQMPSVGIEGCSVSGSYTTGWLNLFPNYSGNPFSDEACQVVTGSYDPNDKQAFPIGVDNQHFIEPNTPVDYQIRFQNTGTDTALTVIVKDTLATWLDPTTLRPGAASHPYTWTLSGAGILTFTFNNIFLPDSNVNEVASHGFVQFYIDQHKDVPLGTILENRAGIYFDFNEPVMTNTVWHTIGREFLTTATHEPGMALPSLQVWPNPASQSTSIWAEKPFESGQRLVLRDALGRVVREMAVQGQTTELQRAGLPTGLYFLELCGAGRTLAVGKVVWK